MVMQDQAQRLSEPLRWGRREKTVVGVTLGCVVAVVVALVIAFAASGGKAHEASNCIRVTFASTLGGADLHGCGAQAQRICASGSFPHITSELRAACEHAGYAFKQPS